jgi:hypothetical protein
MICKLNPEPWVVLWDFGVLKETNKMKKKKPLKVEYANFLSRLLLSQDFKYQYTIPPSASSAKKGFLQFYENLFLNVDLTGIEIEKPIFIVSLPRTGSTMLNTLMSAHDDVAYFSHLMNVSYPHFCAMDHIRTKLKLELNGERFIGDSIMVNLTGPSDPIPIFNKWIRKDPFVPKYLSLTKASLSEEQIDEIFTSIKKAIWCMEGNRSRFLMKSPGIIPYLPLVRELFPDAKYVHLVRDPRPCANSLIKLAHKTIAQGEMITRAKKKFEYSGKTPVTYPHLPNLPKYLEQYGIEDIRTAANIWKDGMDFVEHEKDTLDHFFEVRFEDILLHPETSLRNIFEFCELTMPDKTNLNFWKNLNGVGTIHHKNQYAQFELIEEICKGTMERYGYYPGKAVEAMPETVKE